MERKLQEAKVLSSVDSVGQVNSETDSLITR